MKVIQVKCGSCGAGLDADEGTSWVTCEYCGTKSRIQRRTGMFRLEELVARDAPVSVQATPRAAKVIIVLSFVASILVGVGALLFFVLRLNTGGPGGPGLTGSNPQWEGTGGALFADVNGDGALDVVGRLRYLGDADAIHLAAFDGRTGERLWQSEALGSYTDTYQGKAAVAGEAVLFGDAQGELHAFSIKDGKRLWRIPLGEQTAAMCADEPGLVTVETTDKKLRRYHLADGTATQAEAGGAGQPAACRKLADDRRAVDAGLAELDRRRPKIEGLNVREIFRLADGGPILVTGNAEPGTRVPMVALLSAEGDLRWKSEVPAANRLKASEGPPELVASDGQRLFVLYRMRDMNAPGRLAAFQISDGRRLWERGLESSMPLSAVQTASDRVLVSSWGRLDAFGAADGQAAYTIGWSMK